MVGIVARAIVPDPINPASKGIAAFQAQVQAARKHSQLELQRTTILNTHLMIGVIRQIDPALTRPSPIISP
jgi:hypothetical protein